MGQYFTTLLGKTVKRAASLRGGGSALPGLVVERIDPDFIKRTLAGLPRGTVVISGTNGKTTTTKMIVELLESQGIKVFTNRTGSNFTRGVAAALLGEVDRKGKLNADIAVLELDEAHAVHFVRVIKPRYSLLLNVMRDQLDRFGEIDTTARLLAKIAEATSERVVINREDKRLLDIGTSLPEDKVTYFGLDPDLRSAFPSDEELHGYVSQKQTHLPRALVTLEEFSGHKAVFALGSKKATVDLKLDGIYNIFNAAGALAMVMNIVGSDLKYVPLLERLAQITPAFGRGETISINGSPCELVLVKNPSGFRLGLKSFSPKGVATMIAINDNYADGRDMSWLWDVDFASLAPEGVAQISGIRAYDMALRLQYDGVEFSHIETDLKLALKYFLKANPDKPKRIFCTYTAMLTLRRELAKITDVERVS